LGHPVQESKESHAESHRKRKAKEAEATYKKP
jgi:hypothetical protein